MLTMLSRAQRYARDFCRLLGRFADDQIDVLHSVRMRIDFDFHPLFRLRQLMNQAIHRGALNALLLCQLHRGPCGC